MSSSRHAWALSRRFVAIVSCAWLLGLVGGALAHPEDEPAGPELRAEISQWIEDLRSDEFARRDEARAGLEEHGLRAIDLLRAAQDDEDPEVRRTIRRILDGVAVEEEPVLRPGALDRVGLVSWEAGGLRAALDHLGEHLGLQISAPDADPGTPVEAGDAVPTFLALERLAAAAGLTLPSGPDRLGTLDLVAAKEAPAPTPSAHAGPFRLVLTEVTATRVLGPGDRRRYALLFRLEWTPGVQLVQYRMAHVVEALDPEGRAYAAGSAMRNRVIHGVSSNALQASVQVHLEPAEEETAERLAVLEIELPLRIRHGLHRLRFETPEDAELPRVLALDGSVRTDPGPGTVTLQALARPDGGSGGWVADLTAHLPGVAPQNSLHVVLEKADGTALRHTTGGRSRTADGRVELSARLYNQEERPQALVAAWFALEEEGVFTFRLEDVPLR